MLKLIYSTEEEVVEESAKLSYLLSVTGIDSIISSYCSVVILVELAIFSGSTV